MSVIDLRYSTNCGSTLTANKPVYLVGVIDSTGAGYTLDTTWWTQTLPTSEDGKIYIYLGTASSTTSIGWIHEHPIYWYKNSAVRLYEGNKVYVPLAGDATITGVKTFSTSSGFNYSGIENATSNSARNVWFSHASKIGTPCYNDSFKYNPSTDVLTVGSITGTAAKATGDKNGLDITNYIKGLSISGKVITYTKGDNTTGTITTQDTVYTLPIAGTGVNGTLGGIKVGSGLIIDSGTGVLSATGGGTADSVEWSGVLNKPTNISYWTNDSGYITLANVMSGATASTAGTAGVVPAPGSGSQAKFLRGDGEWAEVSTADTKNTTGTTNTTSKIYLAGATEQSANPQTYSNVNCYASGGKLYSNAKEVVNLSDTQALTNKTYNGYTLAAASAKAVDTSISAASTSTNLPTSQAVATFVEGKGYVTVNTTYTLSADTTNNKITLTPSSGTAQSITVPYATNAGTATATSGTLTIQKNGTSVATFNGSTATANILVPVVYTGTSTPSASTGVNGDIYIQTT